MWNQEEEKEEEKKKENKSTGGYEFTLKLLSSQIKNKKLKQDDNTATRACKVHSEFEPPHPVTMTQTPQGSCHMPPQGVLQVIMHNT